MIQPLRLHGRLPQLALIVLALATLVTISLARISTGTGPRTSVVTSSAMTTDLVPAERPLVVQTAPASSEKTGCGSGAYVSGDIAGEASPAEIYAAMCPGR